MSIVVVCVILIVGLFTLFYFRLPPRYALPISAVVLLIVSSALPFVLLIIFWLIWFIVTLLLVIAPLRWYLVVKPFLHWFRGQQPPISASERDVLEAGGTWFEKQFFLGRPQWQQLFQLPAPRLTPEEQSFVDNQTETLCRMIDDWQMQQQQDLPEAVWNYIKKEGFWALIIEKKYGGRGFSALAHSTVVTKIASRSASVAITVMVPNSLGPSEFLTHYGTEAQKQRYLPRFAKGDEVGCFALTAPLAGSDASSIPDVGVVCQGDFQGETIVGIRLNWDKRYITLAPIATLIAVVFRLYDPDHLLGGREHIGITIALIPADLPGVERGARHRPMNLAFLNGPVRGRDVFIPFDLILGGVERCGDGWRMMMECLSLGRGISLPGLSAGMMKLSFCMSGAYAQIRHQFKRSIGDFEGVGASLGEIGGFTYLCEATRLFTAQAVDYGARPSIASAITKYHLTELARKAVNNAMDIHAGRGIQFGPRNYLGNLYQALPIGITVEGANILTRNLIIFGQGVMRCHPYLRDELIASENAERGRNKVFDKLWLSHMGFALQNFTRVLVYGLSGGRGILIDQPGRLKKYLRQLTRMSYALSLVNDIAMAAIGAELKLKESLSARLGDVLSHLYMASAVMKFYQEEGQKAEDWPFVVWSLDYCLAQIQQAWDEFFINFPQRFLAGLMRWIIFPWGRAYFPPTDQHTQTIANVMQETSVMRDRLSRYCYIGDVKQDATGQMEAAFQDWQAVKLLWPKLYKFSVKVSAMTGNQLQPLVDTAYEAGQLTKDEHEKLTTFAKQYWDVLRVDEFEGNNVYE